MHEIGGNSPIVGESTESGTAIAVAFVMGMRVLENGTILQDRFLIEEKIGVGGMGAVYLAADQKFGSRVALKQTFYDNIELAQAFEREARLLNTLHHPVLPYVSDFFSEGGELFLVMEYIEGEDLSEILKRGEIPPIHDVIDWTRELLDALDYLHSQDPPIIHRDIKPNNLKRTPRGNIVLLDFGLAKETSGNTLGMRSVFGYSRRYSPLEQIEGAGTDVRSDIFSVGATIFHLLTGEPPIDVLARASAIVAGRPDPLKLASDVNPDVPIEFAAVIKSALALSADDRFVSAGAMREAFAYAQDASVGDMQSQAAANDLDREPALPVALAVPVLSESVGDGGTVDIHGQPAAMPARPRARYRFHKNLPWLKPALAAAVLLVLMGVAFSIFSSRNADSPEAVAGTTPAVNPESANVSDIELVQDGSDDQKALASGKVSDVKPVSKPTPRKIVDTDNEETKQAENHKAVRPASSSTDRPNRAAVQPKYRQIPRARVNQPPIVTIETIFTGRSASENGRMPDISNEERRERKRLRRLKRQARFPVFY